MSSVMDALMTSPGAVPPPAARLTAPARDADELRKLLRGILGGKTKNGAENFPPLRLLLSLSPSPQILPSPAPGPSAGPIFCVGDTL